MLIGAAQITVIHGVEEGADFADFALLIQHAADTLADTFCCPAQMHFENLADVHPRGHAQGIEHDVYRATVCHIRHVFYRQNARYHTFVTVAAGHFIAGL